MTGALISEKDALILELEERVAKADAAFNTAAASLEEREDGEDREGLPPPQAGPEAAAGAGEP